MRTDRPLLGIALMLGFCALAPLADALAKLVGPQMAIGQLVLLRFVIQFAILMPLALIARRPWRSSGRVLRLIVLRTVLHILGIGAMVAALIHLPLADTVAIAYVMPFILLLLSFWFLGEEIGWRRIAACGVGFAGTLLVVQPAFESVGWPAFLPIAVAVIFAVFMLITRRIAQETDPVGMQALSALIAMGVLLPLIALTPASVSLLAWDAPSREAWVLVLAMGVVGTVAHLLMTWSLRFAPAATVAPMQYLEIPAATLIGFVVFADLPGPLAAAGIALTMAAGLYVILREQAMLRPHRAPLRAHRGHPPAG